MLILSILAGKLVLIVLRLLGKQGSALPGLIVEKLNPRFLQQSIGKLPDGVIVVTGTNGKTTTTKIIAELLEKDGKRVLTNRTGSNFVRGIISVTLDKIHLSGQLPFDIAILEQDEAHAVHFVKSIKPRGVVVLNIMRDQMDRFGEIDTTAQLLARVVAAASEFVVLNANDKRVAGLADHTKAKPVYFGHTYELWQTFISDDSWHDNDRNSYVEAAEPIGLLKGIADTGLTMKLSGQDITAVLKLKGSHNALNTVAALTVMQTIIPDGNVEQWIVNLETIQPAFGRGEVVRIDGVELMLQLVKNPGGFRHSLNLLKNSNYGAWMIAINDDYADGRDVSWLWDVSFEGISAENPPITSGIRAADMAVRLKYDGVPVDTVEEDLERAIGRLIKEAKKTTSQAAIVFCTYTAMLKIRHILSKKTVLNKVEL